MTPLLPLFLFVPVALALTTLPEVFQTFPLAHPAFTSLSARAVAVDNAGNAFVAGTGTPSAPSKTHPVPVIVTHASARTSHSPNETVTSKHSSSHHHHHARHLPLTAPAVFVARVNPAGNIAWIRTLQSNGSDSVSAIALHHNHLFVVGTSTGSVENSSRNSPHGKSSVFVAKLSKAGENAWKKPLMFGSGGVDIVSAVAVDGTKYFPHLYISGSVGGEAFPTAKRDALDTQAQDANQAEVMITSHRLATSSNPVDVQEEMEKEKRRRRESTHERTAQRDLFVAKIDPGSGKLDAAVQIPLDRDNSADALAVCDGVVYAAVNSFNAAPFDPAGNAALYAFRASDLAYHAVTLPAAFNRPGEYIQAMASDQVGNVYLAGFVLRGHLMEDGKFVLRKFAARDRVVEWERILGNYSKVEPWLSIAIGRSSGNVFVAGHSTGLYQNQDGQGGELVRLPLTVFSPDGRELMSWDRMSTFPKGYEEISSLALDKDENVVYAGKWLSPVSERLHATVGSFGARSFTTRASTEGASSSSSALRNSKGIAASTIGLICMAVGFALVLVGAAITMGRAKVLGDKGLVFGTDGGSEEVETGTMFDRMNTRSRFPSSSDEMRMMVRGGSNSQMKAGGSAGPI